MVDCGLLPRREKKVLYSTRYLLQPYQLQVTFFSINNSNALQHSSRMIRVYGCGRHRWARVKYRLFIAIRSVPVVRKSEFSANGLAASNVYLWGGRIDVVGIVSVSTFPTGAHLRGLLSPARIFPIPFLSRRSESFRERITRTRDARREFESRRSGWSTDISEKSMRAIITADTQIL